jgi:hypothetical protein
MSKAKGKRKTGSGKSRKTNFKDSGKTPPIKQIEVAAPIYEYDNRFLNIFLSFMETFNAELDVLRDTIRHQHNVVRTSPTPADRQALFAMISLPVTDSIPIIEAVDRATDGKRNFFSNQNNNLEDDGWVLVKDWPELFRLYERGGYYKTIAYPNISAIRNALLRGHLIGDIDTAKVEEALLLVAAGRTISSDFYKENDLGIEKYAFMHLVDAIGHHVLKAYAVDSKDEAEAACDDAVSIFKKAMRGILRMHHYIPSQHTGELFPRAVMAISFADLHCCSTKRLPTKSELRSAMEQAGFGYSSNSKGIAGKWREMFETAGLGELPD